MIVPEDEDKAMSFSASSPAVTSGSGLQLLELVANNNAVDKESQLVNIMNSDSEQSVEAVP